MENIPEQNRPRLVADVIPSGVDQDIGSERNRIIRLWRDGGADAMDVAGQLRSLYWSTLGVANTETSMYLIDGALGFCTEAGLTLEEIGEAWRKSKHKNQ